MLNYDEILDQKITALENGAPLESVLQDLPDEARELETLLRLAAAVRSAPHPEPAAETIHAQRAVVMAEAERATQPSAQPATLRTPGPMPGQSGAAGNLPLRQRLENAGISWKWLTGGFVLAAAAVTVMVCVVAFVGTNLWLKARTMSTARVEAVSGQAQVAANSAGTTWKNIAAGYRVRKGERIRTLGASSATLVFFDGTRSLLSPNTEVAFNDLSGKTGGILQVKMDQIAGETWNTVTPFRGKQQSYFLVQTPSGTASVHGTNFNVRVGQDGRAQFSVNSGEVRVQNNDKEVTLLSGQATAGTAAGGFETPTYMFSVSGTVMDISAEKVWAVDNVDVQQVDSTVVTGDPQLGDMVKVSGRILDGVYIADSIDLSDDSELSAYFTGTLDAKDTQTWTIGGETVQVDANTIFAGNLEIGTPVRVTFEVQSDGSTWLAKKIEALSEEPASPSPAPTPSATPDPRAMPGYAFKPEELEVSSCGSSDFHLTGTLRNTASQAKDYAAGVQLGYLIDAGGDFVNRVELAPSSWERIDAGQSVTFNIHVTLNDRWASAGDDAAVKLRIHITQAINRPTYLDGQLSVDIEAGCKVTPTPGTPSITNTPQATPTGLSNQPEAQDADKTGQCTGANPHPTGMKLAQRYNVPYEEIMHWFCQHYGFGEIDLAYSLSRQSGKPVESIFAMRASGMGWGQIKKSLGPDLKKNGKPGKGNKKDK